MLEIYDLKKFYEDVYALKGISFNVEKGEIFALLGPNGAGKTTTISILTTLIKPDSGEVIYDEKSVFDNIKWWRGKIGIVPQEMSFYEEITAKENIVLMGTLYGMSKKEAEKRADYLLEITGLSLKTRSKVYEFSGGMKRRLNIALGIVHKPEVLFLDEPTVGIDVQTRVHIREFLRELSESENVTIIYTTHQLEEAEELCKRIAIMDEGEIKAIGTMKELEAKVGEFIHVDLKGEFGKEIIESTINRFKKINLLKFSKENISIQVPDELLITEIIDYLFTKKVKLKTVDIRRPNLETLFLKLTGKELKE